MDGIWTWRCCKATRSFRQLASFAATVSDVHFMICDKEGHVLLTTDKSLEGRVVTMPESMTREIVEDGLHLPAG